MGRSWLENGICAGVADAAVARLGNLTAALVSHESEAAVLLPLILGLYFVVEDFDCGHYYADPVQGAVLAWGLLGVGIVSDFSTEL